MSTEQPSLRKASDESLNELEKELAALRAENRKLQRALQEESLRHEACEELINLVWLCRSNHRGTVANRAYDGQSSPVTRYRLLGIGVFSNLDVIG